MLTGRAAQGGQPRRRQMTRGSDPPQMCREPRAWNRLSVTFGGEDCRNNRTAAPLAPGNQAVTAGPFSASEPSAGVTCWPKRLLWSAPNADMLQMKCPFTLADCVSKATSFTPSEHRRNVECPSVFVAFSRIQPQPRSDFLRTMVSQISTRAFSGLRRQPRSFGDLAFDLLYGCGSRISNLH